MDSLIQNGCYARLTAKWCVWIDTSLLNELSCPLLYDVGTECSVASSLALKLILAAVPRLRDCRSCSIRILFPESVSGVVIVCWRDSQNQHTGKLQLPAPRAGAVRNGSGGLPWYKHAVPCCTAARKVCGLPDSDPTLKETWTLGWIRGDRRASSAEIRNPGLFREEGGGFETAVERLRTSSRFNSI
ncbi:hypothetical protein CONLIGDRAFT_61485 [Coniochaeta ligniaria NRRL 30616]|uniref:Uncharacterized protein n=1 Tax=Coniochaeta ligniaria NRRL 30616 TaxID=1408157 RepID=A0A1J7K5J3_9PEZI|nr:hypothetical protein CONLIGDRAFT_61485 [Coniochaeta ligniaria NRRL 30616]